MSFSGLQRPQRNFCEINALVLYKNKTKKAHIELTFTSEIHTTYIWTVLVFCRGYLTPKIKLLLSGVLYKPSP